MDEHPLFSAWTRNRSWEILNERSSKPGSDILSPMCGYTCDSIPISKQTLHMYIIKREKKYLILPTINNKDIQREAIYCRKSMCFLDIQPNLSK